MIMLTPTELAQASTLALIGLFGVTAVFLLERVSVLFKNENRTPFAVSLPGEKTRTFFMMFLCVSTLMRVVSLVILYRDEPLLEPPEAAGGGGNALWTYALLQGVPAIMFLSTYSVIILFWAQVYYTARFVILPYLRPSFGFLNAGVYLVVLLTAFLTRALGAYAEFRTYMALLVGSLYSLTSFALGFFGFKVAFQFSGDTQDRQQDARKAAIVRRVLSVSVLCPLLFQIRGLFELALGLELFPRDRIWQGQPLMTWELLLIFLSEWIPATAVLISFWPPHAPSNRDRGANSERISGLSSPLMASHVPPYRPPSRGKDDVMLNFAPPKVYPLGSSHAIPVSPGSTAGRSSQHWG